MICSRAVRMKKNSLAVFTGSFLVLAEFLSAQEPRSLEPLETTQGPGLVFSCPACRNLDVKSPPPSPVRKETSSAGRDLGKQSGPPKSHIPGFGWKGAVLQSGFFLGTQHGFRMFTAETRRELDGPFLRDYWESLQGLTGWGDGDKWPTNYVGHPMMGAVAGYIQIHNDPRGIRQEFGRDPAYWKSRLKALGWAAAYSTQFELGPISEASLGNVGQRPGTMGFVDLVITPVGGFGLIILEDILDKYWIGKLEARTSSRNARGFYRIALNPTRSLANFFRLHHTYDRDTR